MFVSIELLIGVLTLVYFLTKMSSFAAWLERKYAANKFAPKPAEIKKVIPDDECSSKKSIVDHGLWDSLLKKYVKPGVINGVKLNTVDYKGLAEDGQFKEYKEMISNLNIENISSNEELCLYINCYNFFCVGLIVDYYNKKGNLPKSINNLSSLRKAVWDKPAGVIAGKSYTLSEIEHDVLRTYWKEPRVHASIVCASVSCPDLRGEAFVVSRLNEQMDSQSRSWMANDKKGACTKQKNLIVSRIFNWFYQDFADSPKKVTTWISKYAEDGSSVKQLAENGEFKLKYMDYNWDLNVCQE